MQQLLPDDPQRVMTTGLGGRCDDCGQTDPALLCHYEIIATRSKQPSDVYSITLCDRCLAESERVKDRLHGYSVVRMIPINENALPSDLKMQWRRLLILTLLVLAVIAMATLFGRGV